MERLPCPDQVGRSTERADPVLDTERALTLRAFEQRLEVTLLGARHTMIGHRPAECDGITDLLRDDDVLCAVVQSGTARLGILSRAASPLSLARPAAVSKL